MKNLLIAFLLLTSIGFQAQKTKIETGVYKGSAQGQEIMLNLNEDKSFQMSFFYGNYTIENDSVYFKSTIYDESKFQIKPIADTDYSSTLKLRLDNEFDGYYTSSIFVGTQTNKNTQISYQRLSDLINEDAYDTTIENIIVNVSKCQFLYLVSLDYDQATSVAKYEIGDEVNELEITYNPYSIKDVKLIGYIDEESKKLAITDAKKAVFFTIAKDEGLSKNDNTLNALSVTQEKDWAKNNGFESENETVDGYTDYTYKFKHSIDKSFDTALTTLKKTPSKFLVVSVDLKNDKKLEEFNTFILTSEGVISSYMYDTYNEEYDNFNFYLATDKDKKLLDKNGITSSQEILVYNSNGDLLYHTSGTLTDNSDFFTPYSELTSHLEKANVSISIDKVLSNKKASLTELTEAFKKASSTERSYDAYDTVSVVEAASEEAIDDSETSEIDVVNSDSYETQLKDKDHLYHLKSTQQMVQSQFSKMVDAYFKNDAYNADFISIVKKELANDGFNARMFNDENEELTEVDFKSLDYVYKHLNEIENEEAKATSAEDYDYYMSDQSIATILEQTVFNYTNTSGEYVSDLQVLNKTMEYYKRYLDSSDTDFTAYYNYLNALKTVETDGLSKNYLDTYQKLYESIVSKELSLIESLDASYSKKYREQSWTDFKSMFAGLGNTTAWYVVENDTKNSHVANAITWSETSIVLDKNNHYYLDTLAQLYYKNGQKEKAMATEQKAISLVEDDATKSDYQFVLNKMKDGTYGEN